MDRRTVESLCSIRGTPEIVNILTCEIDENAVGQGTKTTLKMMLQAVIACLVWERDNKGMQLNFKAIREHTKLEGIALLSVKGGGSTEMREPLIHYLKELQGFDYDAVNDDGTVNEAFTGPHFNLEGARKMHDFTCSLFLKLADKAGM